MTDNQVVFEAAKSSAIEILSKDFGLLLPHLVKDPLSTEALEQFGAKIIAMANKRNNVEPWEHDGLIRIVCDHLRTAKPLPEDIANYAADFLEGKVKVQRYRGRSPNDNFLRDVKLHYAASKIAHDFELPLYSNNEATNQLSSADVISAASQSASGFRRVSKDVVIRAIKKFDWQIGGI